VKVNFLSALAMTMVLVLGCAKTNSDNIKTSGFYAEYTVAVDATTNTVAKCSASFRVEAGGTFIDLSANDTVTCNGQSMARSEIAGIVTYSTNLTATVGGIYTVVLTRSGESPYSASVTLPAAVVTSAPANNGSFSKGAPLSLAWTISSNAADAIVVTTSRVTTDSTKCPNNALYANPAPEAGIGSFTAMDMALPTATGTAGTCNMNVNWQRQRLGTMPSGLNGSIYGIQSSSVPIILN
jgi:hypothetical protein